MTRENANSNNPRASDAETKRKAAEAVVRLMEQAERDNVAGSVSVRIPINRGRWGKIREITEIHD